MVMRFCLVVCSDGHFVADLLRWLWVVIFCGVRCGFLLDLSGSDCSCNPQTMGTLKNISLSSGVALLTVRRWGALRLASCAL